MDIGTKIRILRKEKGLSQAKLAAIAGYSDSTISDLEAGLNNPSFASLCNIAKALDIKPSELLEGVELD